jgi:hypothetical protein
VKEQQMQGRIASYDGSRRAHAQQVQGRTASYDGSRRAREPLPETHTGFFTDLFNCEPTKDLCVKEQKMQGCTGSYNGSRRAHEAHEEKRTDILTDVFSSFINLTRNEEAPIWEQGRTQDPKNRDRLFKSSWRQFGLLSCLDDETMQECVSCMKVKRCCDCVDAYFRVAKDDIQRAPQVQSFAKGATIIKKGSVGTALYFLDMGTARVAIE